MTTQETPFSKSELEDYQNFASETIEPTAEEIAMADAIINRAWKLAQASKPESPEQIWAEFEIIRAKIFLE